MPSSAQTKSLAFKWGLLIVVLLFCSLRSVKVTIFGLFSYPFRHKYTLALCVFSFSYWYSQNLTAVHEVNRTNFSVLCHCQVFLTYNAALVIPNVSAREFLPRGRLFIYNRVVQCEVLWVRLQIPLISCISFNWFLRTFFFFCFHQHLTY